MVLIARCERFTAAIPLAVTWKKRFDRPPRSGVGSPSRDLTHARQAVGEPNYRPAADTGRATGPMSRASTWNILKGTTPDPYTLYMDDMYAIDAIQACGAKLILVTPKMRTDWQRKQESHVKLVSSDEGTHGGHSVISGKTVCLTSQLSLRDSTST